MRFRMEHVTTFTIPVALLVAAVSASSAQTFDPSPAWMEPEVYYREFGYTVARCGDLNGDGFGDVIVGAPFYDLAASEQPGAVQIYLGTQDGLSETPAWFWSGDFVDTLGWDVAFAGDVNDDGYDDVAFSFGGFSPPSTHGMYVQLGASSGYGLWTFDTGAAYSGLGPSIDGAGDVNGDSYDDLVAGFQYSDGDRGRLRVFHGSPLGLPLLPDSEIVGDIDQEPGTAVRFAGDVDADGYDDVLACDAGSRFLLYPGSAHGLETDPAWNYPQGTPAGCHFRRIAAAGDLNDDGYDDVVTGLTEYAPGPDDYGFRVFLGSSGGLEDEPAQTLIGEGSFGWSFASVGDVNGDGFDDLAVGAPDEAGGGRVYLHLGSEVGLQPQPAWANDPIPGSGNLGFSVSSAGDVNGDGLVDLLVGDPGALGGLGRAVLFLGIQPLTFGAAGSIDDASLRLGRGTGGHVDLTWSASCAAGYEDYAVYRGTLGDFDSHAPVTCSSGGSTRWTVSGDDGDRYYLVVPRTIDSEGSYGRDGFAVERTPSPSACFPQVIAACF